MLAAQGHIEPEPLDLDAPEPITAAAILRSIAFRLVVFGGVVVLTYEAVYAGILKYGAGYMAAEDGPLELAHLGLAVLTSLCMFYAASRVTVGRAGLIACACLAGYAAAREGDAYLEAHLFDDAYKWLFGLPLLLVFAWATWVQRRTFVADCFWLSRQPVAILFVVGGIYLIGVGQILDRIEMWDSLGGQSDAKKATKEMVEEYVELFAFLLLAYSGVEAIVMARANRRKLAGDG